MDEIDHEKLFTKTKLQDVQIFVNGLDAPFQIARCINIIDGYQFVQVRPSILDMLLTRLVEVHFPHNHDEWLLAAAGVAPLYWRKRRMALLQRLYMHAFAWNVAARDGRPLYALIRQFVRFAAWHDAPGAFSLTQATIGFVDWTAYPVEQARIFAKRFEREEDFLVWRLARPLDFVEERTLHIQDAIACVRRLREIDETSTITEKQFLEHLLDALEEDRHPGLAEMVRTLLAKMPH